MLKLNPSIVMKKSMGPSCLASSFSPPPLISSSVVFSPPIVLKRGTRSSALFQPLRVASPKATRLVKITPTRQLKEMSDSLSSDDDDDDDEGEDQDSDDEDSDDEYDDRSLDVVRKFMKYVDQLVDQKRDVKSLGKVEDSDDDDEPSVELVRQYMKYMDKLMQKRDGGKSGNYIKEDDEAVYVRTEMPGLSKEDVKVTVEKNLLVVKGKERKDAGDDEKGMNYNGKFKLETELYKIDKIKAEMKNGVLMVVVPKLKEEERKDIIQVKVD